MSKTAIISVLLLFGILMAAVSSLIGRWSFDRKVKKEIKAFLDANLDSNQTDIRIIDRDTIKDLPSCVQKWLERSQVIGREKIRWVHLKQRGLMRLAEDKPWMPVEAEQYFTLDRPGFIWKARVKMLPFLYFDGRDKYFEGRGRMLIKLLSLFPVVNTQGKEVDQGSLLRFLAEIQWFPTAALNSYIQWDEIDAGSARATMTYGSVTASGIFNFNEKGDLISFAAKRYRENNGSYILTDWGGTTKAYNIFDGIRVPSRSDIFWRLETGDFNWFQCEISEIKYNKEISDSNL